MEVNQGLDLYQTPIKKLDKFIMDNLQPDENFLKQARRAIDTIGDFLRHNCFRDSTPPPPRVLKVVKGGSLGKGTALKAGSDADIVVFLTTFKKYKDQEENRKLIIEEIRKRLVECQEKKQFEVHITQSEQENPRVLSFKLRSKTIEDYVEFDLLPAFDALGQITAGYRPSPQVYIDLFNNCSHGGAFSTCFTELQRNFIIERPPKLKSLIRLVKHWYKQVRYGGKCLSLPSYALELLTVYAWEQGSQEPDFVMAKGFCTVLWLIQKHENLCVYWTKNYDFENETLRSHLEGQLRKPRPIILDPADPTMIVGLGSRWDLVAEEAAWCSAQECCKHPDGFLVQPWVVPVRERFHSSGRNPSVYF
uniref:2'-5' oligoadenylate synthase n=1 Tax=Sphenodon punctatus TaxID=8508 RepID=A0A8D0GSJ9_SPHPU